jgi:tripartite-type tricarboxylate transporter receptor subunit TctC
MRSRLSIALLSVLALGAIGPAQEPAQAQTYPTRAITIVVPFAQGGLTDIPMRLLASIMQERLGVPVVIENKPGGTGVVGASLVLRSEPDGYTLHSNASGDAQNLHYMAVPYNVINDFAHIGKAIDGPPLVLVVDARLPYRTVADLVADAKANPDKLNFGTSGPTGATVLSLEEFNAAAGIKLQQVPYRGSGQAASSIVTGAVQGAFSYYSGVKPLVDAGQLRPLAVAIRQRIADWPDVPTMEEAGFKGFDYNGFVGLAAPGKTPPQIVAFLNKALNEAINTDLFKSRMAALGMTVPVAADNTPEKFKAFFQATIARNGELAKLAGSRPQTP